MQTVSFTDLLERFGLDVIIKKHNEWKLWHRKYKIIDENTWEQGSYFRSKSTNLLEKYLGDDSNCGCQDNIFGIINKTDGLVCLYVKNYIHIGDIIFSPYEDWIDITTHIIFVSSETYFIEKLSDIKPDKEIIAKWIILVGMQNVNIDDINNGCMICISIYMKHHPIIESLMCDTVDDYSEGASFIPEPDINIDELDLKPRICIKPIEIINNTIPNKTNFEMSEYVKSNNFNYIYMLRTREFRNTGQLIYKIGKTKQHPLARIRNYPKDSEVILFVGVGDCDKIEKELIQLFTEKFKIRKDIGSEYFEGTVDDMKKCIYQHLDSE